MADVLVFCHLGVALSVDTDSDQQWSAVGEASVQIYRTARPEP